MEPIVSDGSNRVLLPDLATLPGHLLWRAAGRVRSAAETSLGEVDLHAYAALLVLAEAGAPLSQQTVADRIAVSRTTLTQVARTLLATDLLRRERNPDDRRAYLLWISTAGEEALARWRGSAQSLEQRLVSPFTAAQRRTLERLVRRLVEPTLAQETPEELCRTLWFLITRAHLDLHRLVSEALAPVGLEPRHIGVLRALTALGPVAQTELGHAVGVSGASTVQITDDLERLGVLERIRPATDRRTQELHLLPSAAPTLAAAHRASDPVIDRWLAPVGEEVGDLVALLRTFVTAT